MLFYLTTLNLAHFLQEDTPALKENEADRQVVAVVEAWKHTDFLCRNYLLNGLDNTLYNVYCAFNTARELWESLDKKYKTEDAVLKKFVVGKFLDYKMLDSKTVISQVQVLQVILHDIHAEGMSLSKSFQVAAIIEKLPPLWKEFKNYLKQKRKEMRLENLIVRLKIEEDNRASEKKASKGFMESKANVVEQGQTSHNNKKKKHSGNGPKQGPTKKFQGKCYVCNKQGHYAKDCRIHKEQGNPKKKRPQANVTEVEDVSNMNLSAIVSEVNFIGSNTKEWWVDTEDTHHVCSNKKMFSSYQIIDVLHVPEIRKNLVSVSLLSKKGFKLVFVSDNFILTKNGMYVGKGYMSNGLFKMNVMTVVPPIKNINKKNTSSTYMLESSNVWHGRLGHVNYDTLRRLINMECLPKFQIDPNHKCEICVESKLTRTSFQSIERRSEPLELIHPDICDMKFIQTKGGKKYFLTLIEDCTRYCYVYLLRSKDEALKMFQHFKNEVENQLDRKIKVIRSDRGGEYEAPFGDFCSQHGIIHQTTAPYSPQQNVVAERKNGTLKEMMNVLLLSSGLPQNLWGEAILSANYILNRIPHKKTNKSPYELWKGRRPSHRYLKVWGCLAKVAVLIPKKVKIGPKTVDYVFIGYAHNSSAYRFLIHKSEIVDMHANTIIESRNASFFENVFSYKSTQESNSSKRTHDTAIGSSQGQQDDDEPKRSKRTRTSKSFGPDFLTYLLEDEPQSFKEAMSSPEAPYWKEAINDEVESILQNHTWELVDLPPGSKPLGYKWIFKKKMKADGSIDKYKDILVIKGYKQKEGLDSPVTRISSIQMLIAIAAIHNLEIHQMDVKTTFLNGDLDEEIYMEQPEGFIVPG